MLNVTPGSEPPHTRQPVLNLPPIIAALLVILLGIHGLREYLLPDSVGIEVLIRFAFIPIRETNPEFVEGLIATGGERIWTFLTYALLHADWPHVILNSLWMAAFGAPVAVRLGTQRFLALSVAGAVAGSLLHLGIYPSSTVPLVGASAAVSAHMAAASRFVFSAGGPMWGFRGAGSYHLPAASLGSLLGNSRVVAFLGMWFGINLLFGLTSGAGSVASGAIAWEAHIGGFLVGLFLFPLFDPVKTR